ncbi:MAG: hypothetical protein EBZ77_10735, partial [Chitinophagia bacterium]|nr:hypothetical protein [Chitinophagia bacterium]
MLTPVASLFTGNSLLTSLRNLLAWLQPMDLPALLHLLQEAEAGSDTATPAVTKVATAMADLLPAAMTAFQSAPMAVSGNDEKGLSALAYDNHNYYTYQVGQQGNAVWQPHLINPAAAVSAVAMANQPTVLT